MSRQPRARHAHLFKIHVGIERFVIFPAGLSVGFDHDGADIRLPICDVTESYISAMISVGGDLSCENLWRYRLLYFWRSLPDSLSDHSWVVVKLLAFPKSSATTRLAVSIVTSDLFLTLRASRA
jgi:hypothetical protein